MEIKEKIAGLVNGAIHVKIINQKDLDFQFGSIPEGTLKSSPQIFAEVKQQAINKNFPDFIFVSCNSESDAECCFKLSRFSWTLKEAIYTYQGTAN